MDTDKKDSIKIQYRGTPIIDTPGGVLLTAMENTKFILPAVLLKERMEKAGLKQPYGNFAKNPPQCICSRRAF
jgi:hypothetical protein